MLTPWSKPMRVESLEYKWDSWPATTGVYIIRIARAIPRIGTTDYTGILYVGKTSNLRNRIWDFWVANHTASGFLWTHPNMARLILTPSIQTVTDVEAQLGRLTVRYATPIKNQQLAKAERAILFAYINVFGEAPPLNLSLAKRWETSPSATDLRWAERGILKRT